MNSRDRIPFSLLTVQESEFYSWRRMEPKTLSLIILPPKKIRPFLLTENAIVRLGRRNSQKCAILILIIGFATLDPAQNR